MTSYLVDTDTVIDFSKGVAAAVEQWGSLAASNNVLGTCDIVVAEFFSGIPGGQHARWRRLFDSLICWPITRPVAEDAGLYRYQFARKGIALGLADSLIAAVARANAAVVVTNNKRHFPMDDVRVMSLSEIVP